MKPLDEYVRHYYPANTLNGSDNRRLLMEILAKKVNALIGNDIREDFYLKNWENLINEISKEDRIKINNMSYLQFPNLKLSIEEVQEMEGIINVRKLTLVISLLCPIYTFFNEFCVNLKVINGSIEIGKIVFLEDEIFRNLIISTDSNIKKLMKKHFSKFTYANHFDLMNTTMDYSKPWGNEDIDRVEYSVYEYLFDSTPIGKIFF